ncbi:hypothetical protein BJ508DRAFT_195281, partial [Ascobolus immersus RN42]
IALAPFIAKGVLVLAGFTTGGVKAGSLAALVHSAIGNVASGSLFALLQSVGAKFTVPVL